MAGLSSRVQLRSGHFRGMAMPSARPLRAAQPPALFTPIRAAQYLQGQVVSTTGEKSAVVAVDKLVVHPVYKKRVKSTTKYTVHVDATKCKEGDVVTLAPCRPLSKTKRFVVEAVIKSGN